MIRVLEISNWKIRREAPQSIAAQQAKNPANAVRGLKDQWVPIASLETKGRTSQPQRESTPSPEILGHAEETPCRRRTLQAMQSRHPEPPCEKKPLESRPTGPPHRHCARRRPPRRDGPRELRPQVRVRSRHATQVRPVGR